MVEVICAFCIALYTSELYANKEQGTFRSARGKFGVLQPLDWRRMDVIVSF